MGLSSKIGGQNRKEWDDFIASIQGIASYLEVGAREGVALRYLVERTPSIKRVGVVELPQGPWGEEGSEVALAENLESLDVPYSLHIGDSKDRAIIESVGPYDLVFIDGDHSYEGARADYENYRPLAKRVAFHDINHPELAKSYGATKLWREVRGDDYIEYIAKNSSKGIGVISGGL